MNHLFRNTLRVIQQLAASPFYSFTVLGIFALGIGANTAIFSTVYSVLLAKLPVNSPGSLVRVAMRVDTPKGVAELPLNNVLLRAIAHDTHTMTDVFGWNATEVVYANGADTQIRPAALVTGNAFRVLGIRPVLGRALSPEDDLQGGGPDGWAAVISYRLWQGMFGGSSGVIGRHLELAGHSITVIGVAPNGFDGVIVGEHPDFFLPLQFEEVLTGSRANLDRAGSLWLETWARLKDGISLAQANAESPGLFKTVASEVLPPAALHSPLIEHSHLTVHDGGAGYSGYRDEYKGQLYLLQALAAVVLLVCCVNLAGLGIARTIQRESTYAVRIALGATRVRIFTGIMFEACVLAVAGGVFAEFLSFAAIRYSSHLLPDLAKAGILGRGVNLPVFSFIVLCVLLCTALYGLGPAWFGSRVDTGITIRAAGHRHSAGKNWLIQYCLVPGQIALALVLTTTAVLLSYTVSNLRSTSLGFKTANVTLAPTDLGYREKDASKLATQYYNLLRVLSTSPSIHAASLSSLAPLSGTSQLRTFTVPGQGTRQLKFETDDIAPGYFSVLGTRLKSGRDFTEADRHAPVCIVNGSAGALLKGGTALGQVLLRHTGSPVSGSEVTTPCQIVGVADNARYWSLREEARPTVFLPLSEATDSLGTATLLVRTKGSAFVRADLVSALQSTAPGTPVAEPIKLTTQLNDSLSRETLIATLSRFFAILATLLSSVGVYGLLSTIVSRQTHDFGIRMAVGATRCSILFLLSRKLCALVGLGIVLGAACSLGVANSVRSFLYGVSPFRPLVLLVSISIIVLAAFLAAALPVLKAVRVDPMIALRVE